jgi:hypothetical protein
VLLINSVIASIFGGLAAHGLLTTASPPHPHAGLFGGILMALLMISYLRGARRGLSRPSLASSLAFLFFSAGKINVTINRAVSLTVQTFSSCVIGVGTKIVSERLGHSSVGITLDTYSHLLPGMQQDAVRLIDTVLGTAINKSKAD